jgi:hypothetical protein
VNRGSDRVEGENPFCTRRTRPGAMRYLFPPGASAEALLIDLERLGWRGAIVGPHGAGKSALLATLLTAVERGGRRVALLTLRDSRRRLPTGWREALGEASPALLAMDGYEQLGRTARFLLDRTCRRRGWGLLVTSHGPVGLPTLVRVEPDVETARRVVAALLGDEPGLVSPDEVAACFRQHDGNLREMLFALYDLYELRRRQGLAGT